MSVDRWGAPADSWTRWISVLGGPEDLLPVVSNPEAKIASHSTMKALGKTPSRYNDRRQVVGIGKWTQVNASVAEVKRWANEPDYGISIQTRRLRAFDIDVEDEAKAERVLKALQPLIADAPCRWRAGTAKCLVPFWMTDDELFKHVLPVDGGMLEVLGNGQQFIAEGTHTSGQRYEWTDGIIPTLDSLELEMLVADVAAAVGTGPMRIARSRTPTSLQNHRDRDIQDGVATWLVDNWETYGDGSDGQIFIACPFVDEHTTDGNETGTAYFPAGSGDQTEGAFICLHAHCAGRPQAEFLQATGFVAGAFDVVDDRESDGASQAAPEATSAIGGPALSSRSTDTDWPSLNRNKAGDIEPTADNLTKILLHPGMAMRHIAYDTFLDEMVQAPVKCAPPGWEAWRAWRDDDYVWLRVDLERRGVKPTMSSELLKAATHAVAVRNRTDRAQLWLARLPAWDGVSRIETFAARGWGWEDSAYARAVGRYFWSALAARILDPGCQADMAPILVGPQGAEKTKSLKAIVPHEDFYVSINLKDRDADVSRLMRGKLLIELEELRGLAGRDQEEVKAFITRTSENWIPKFKEFGTTFQRRFLFVGTTNEDEIFNDPTGERRWLPGVVSRTDVGWIREHRDQLWAEGMALYRLDGVAWQDAESLAKGEHNAFKKIDAWTSTVERWLNAEDDVSGSRPADRFVTTEEALIDAVRMPTDRIAHGHRIRMGAVLKDLGLSRTRVRPTGGGKPFWGFRKSE
jgi:hypothetical protein